MSSRREMLERLEGDAKQLKEVDADIIRLEHRLELLRKRQKQLEEEIITLSYAVGGN